jgi:hypothetical protein
MQYFSFTIPWMQTSSELLRQACWYEFVNFKLVFNDAVIMDTVQHDDRIINEYGLADEMRIRSRLEPQVLEKNLSQCYFCPQEIPHDLILQFYIRS